MIKQLLLGFVFISSVTIGQDCSGIKRKVLSDGSTLISNDLSEQMIFSKSVSKTDTSYFLLVRVEGNIATEDAKGAVIFFDKIDPVKFPDADVTYRNVDGKHVYTASVKLSLLQAFPFVGYHIASAKVYIFQRDIPLSRRERFRKIADCVMSAKH